MYSPWFSNMPGFNNPGYWNYENKLLDNLTQVIYAGNFASESERADLMRAATDEGGARGSSNICGSQKRPICCIQRNKWASK